MGIARFATLAAAGIAAMVACGQESTPEDGSAGRTPSAVIRPAPPFALETLAGDTLTLAALQAEGGVVLLNLWASWCQPCREEVPDLMELHEEYQTYGFTVLGVTVNDLPRDSRAFEEEMGMDYPSVIGTPAMLEDYGLSPWLPTSLLVADGGIVEEWVGPRVKADFEYPVRVALGLAPPLEQIMQDSSASRSPQRGE